MTRASLFVLGLAVALGACNKPSEDSCRKALLNMQHILETDTLQNSNFEGEVRRCKAGASIPDVECATSAQNRDDLVRCHFLKPERPNPGSGSAGSGSAGSDS